MSAFRHFTIIILLAGLFSCTSGRSSMRNSNPGGAEGIPAYVSAYPAPSTSFQYPAPMTAGASDEGYTIGVDDVIKVSVWSRPELSKTSQVQRDGFVIFPILGPIKVKGFSIIELQEKLGHMYSKYVLNPIVDVEVSEYLSRQVYFIGEFQKPGVVPLRRRTSILEAMAVAGGTTPNAYLANSYILREGQIIPLDLYTMLRRGLMDQNYELRDRDVIFIPSIADQKVMVLGYVKNPGIVQMFGSNFTVVEAITSAGGFVLGAIKDDVKIIRGGLRNPVLISADVERMLDGEVESPSSVFLTTGDIVYVPQTRLAAWNDVIGLINPSIQFFLLQPAQIAVDYFLIRDLSKK